LCRKEFKKNLLMEFIEELEEAEEWERDEVEELESQTADALAEHAKELALFMKRTPGVKPESNKPQRLQMPLSWSTPQDGGDTQLRQVVQTFCKTLDSTVRNEFQNDVCKEFLPPQWRRRWWDLEEDVDDCGQQLFLLQEGIQYMLQKVKEVVSGICNVDPMSASSHMKSRYERMLKTEDNIRSNVANIEKQLGDLVGKVNRPEVTAATHQQLKDFDAHLQRERDYKEEGVYLAGMVELPSRAAGSQRHKHKRRLRGSPGSRPGSRPSSAASNGRPASIDSSSTGDNGPTISDMVTRFQWWRTAAVERICDRYEILLHKRQNNVLKAASLFSRIEGAVKTNTSPRATSPLMAAKPHKPANLYTPFDLRADQKPYVPENKPHLKALRRSLEFPPGAQLLSLKAGLEAVDLLGRGEDNFESATSRVHAENGSSSPKSPSPPRGRLAPPKPLRGAYLSNAIHHPHVPFGLETTSRRSSSGSTATSTAELAKPPVAHAMLVPSPLKSKAKLSSKMASDTLEMQLQETSLGSADGLDIYRRNPNLLAT
jgi:hypothetical protein